MYKIGLANNEELDILAANATTEYFQGENRSCIEFQFTKGIKTFEEFDVLFGDHNKTKQITIATGPTGAEEKYLHEGYVLRVSMMLKSVQIPPAKDGESPTYEERMCIKMAQKSYRETEIETLKDALSKVIVSTLEV